MPCPVLESLSSSVTAVERLPVPVGLGAQAPLDEQVQALACAIDRLQRELAIRMAARERADPRTSDVVGEAVRSGMAVRSARRLRRLGRFAGDFADVEREWRSGSIRAEQVELLHAGVAKVSALKGRELVDEVLPLLPGLDENATRQVVAFAVDQLKPGDPDHEEVSEHAARRLAWSRVARGGVVLEGYLPAAEGAAFTAAIDALVESLRVSGDQLTPAQRRADALAMLVATATQSGLPTNGGLPAAMTLTVSLSEATRVALRDPAGHGSGILVRPQGSSTLNGHAVGDATVRFGVCCAAITPVLTNQPGDPPTQPGAHPARPTDKDDRPAGPPTRLTPSRGTAPAHGLIPGSLLDRLAKTPVQPLAVGRSVRLATPAQRHALRIRDRGCAIPGCAVDAACTQPHHVVGWAVGGSTDLDQMVSLCWVHHRMTDLGRFRFIARKDGEPRPHGALEHPLWWIIPPVGMSRELQPTGRSSSRGAPAVTLQRPLEG